MSHVYPKYIIKRVLQLQKCVTIRLYSPTGVTINNSANFELQQHKSSKTSNVRTKNGRILHININNEPK